MKIKRKIYDQIGVHLKEKEITMLIGPRQAGKTTIMKALAMDLEKDGFMYIYLNLDVERDMETVSSQENFLAYLKNQFTDFGYVFIDEFQKKENAGAFLKGLYDMNLPYKFIISGSGSIELKERTHESLAGRKRLFVIYPLSFEEFALYKSDYRYSNLKDLHQFDTVLEEVLIEEYLKYGGYPRVVLSSTNEEKYLQINEIVESFLHKDALSFIKYEKLDDMRNLIKALAVYNANVFSYEKLSQSTRMSSITIKNYIRYLEETHILERVLPFSNNKINEIVKMPVIYFIDIGLLNYCLGNFGIKKNEKDGFIFQNIIWRILKEIHMIEIRHWRTKDHKEIDFIVEKGNDLYAIEVKYSKNPRMNKALYTFAGLYKNVRKIIVCVSTKDVVNDGKNEIELVEFSALTQSIR